MARPGARVLPLCPERLIVVISPALLRPDCRPETLLDYPLIQQATRPELWTDWSRAGGVEPFRQLRGRRLEHFDIVLVAAQAGLGVALLPDIFAAQAIYSGALLNLFPEIAVEGSDYALIRPASAEPRSAV